MLLAFWKNSGGGTIIQAFYVLIIIVAVRFPARHAGRELPAGDGADQLEEHEGPRLLSSLFIVSAAAFSERTMHDDVKAEEDNCECEKAGDEITHFAGDGVPREFGDRTQWPAAVSRPCGFSFY